MLILQGLRWRKGKTNKKRERVWRERSKKKEIQMCELMVKAARKPIELFSACLAYQGQKQQQIISGFCFVLFFLSVQGV